jgi:hypothetical protein
MSKTLFDIRQEMFETLCLRAVGLGKPFRKGKPSQQGVAKQVPSKISFSPHPKRKRFDQVSRSSSRAKTWTQRFSKP